MRFLDNLTLATMKIKTMKQVIFLILFLSLCSFLRQMDNYVNPTGEYKLNTKTIKKNGETYGYFGDMKVVTLSKDKILISFFVCKGAPSYNSGSFVDTLEYKNNVAIYKSDSISDPSCNMKMVFTQKGVDVELKSDNPNFACGFGQAVDSQGFYKRVKGKIPRKEEILLDAER